ncbi:WecB/TagA/CpsF family glycosyltransferase [Bradyrhizobium sp. LHD-71]|uniref:WecB/TagA/CpsF family glycosyltransferase n=1 Tax=Bradyrhizobium sp. LHD-71 TaxID=3072141 RepID=UPI00280FABB8|nr:WecB/TagA/CpsF family glycosyltransferase [Bradyrhizobium sp. LHD-71]MDQ8726672.1 WecB/TagA/CpsF family glycosyltransferase [Bradyrhizobium sp. LHD-71]
MSLVQSRSKAENAQGRRRERRDAERRCAAFMPAAELREKIGEDRRQNADRRRNPFRRWRRVRLGGLPVVVVDRTTTAKVMVDHALRRRGLWRYPAYLTSTNGEVTHACANDRGTRSLFMQADAIHADGMPHVFVSRLRCKAALPERVATTDLFDAVNEEAERRGASIYMLGATEEVSALAAEVVQKRFPKLNIVGRRNGFFESLEAEKQVCEEIAALCPDILWVSMGVPREQEFVIRNRNRLTSIGVIKTSGGLFDFVSGTKPRAPAWMQRAGLEWLWRAALEPRRLGWRYVRTNPSALYLLLTKSD